MFYSVFTNNLLINTSILLSALNPPSPHHRNTGYTQEAAKVAVDSVPSVSLYGDLDVTAPTTSTTRQQSTKKDASLHRTKQPRVVKEKGQACEYQLQYFVSPRERP